MSCTQQAFLSFPVSQSLLTHMSIESVMLSNHFILFCTPFSFSFQSFSASGSFPISWIFASGVQSFGPSASTSILPINIQDRFPSGFIGLISLQYKGLLRFFCSTTIQKHQLFAAQTFLWSNFHIFPYMSTGKTIASTIRIFVGKMMPLLFNIPLGLS